MVSSLAYKRVAGMIHSADMGRGVIGVIDVYEMMVGILLFCLEIIIDSYVGLLYYI